LTQPVSRAALPIHLAYLKQFCEAGQLRNRVSPTGEIFVTPARGTFMGNRGGVIHNDRKEIVRPYASRRWIACFLEFKGRHRVVMSPNRYTELFFLDEAVALAAGHRPCAECRRERFNAFRKAWSPNPITADAMDLELHPARIDSRKAKVTYRAPLASLPDGCFIEHDGASYLVWGNALIEWSPGSYGSKRSRPADLTPSILTPEPIVRCLLNGYKPEIHPSAQPNIVAGIPTRAATWRSN
jgi:hypothetical protein